MSHRDKNNLHREEGRKKGREEERGGLIAQSVTVRAEWQGGGIHLEPEYYSDHDPYESRKACSLSEMNLSFLLGQKEGNGTGSLSLMLHGAGRT